MAGNVASAIPGRERRRSSGLRPTRRIAADARPSSSTTRDDEASLPKRHRAAASRAGADDGPCAGTVAVTERCAPLRPGDRCHRRPRPGSARPRPAAAGAKRPCPCHLATPRARRAACHRRTNTGPRTDAFVPAAAPPSGPRSTTSVRATRPSCRRSTRRYRSDAAAPARHARAEADGLRRGSRAARRPSPPAPAAERRKPRPGRERGRARACPANIQEAYHALLSPGGDPSMPKRLPPSPRHRGRVAASMRSAAVSMPKPGSSR